MRAKVLTMLLTVGAVAVCATLLVAWPSPAAAAVTFRVSSPAPYQVFQRSSDGLGGIAVKGVCRGLGPLVQARWGGDMWRTTRVRADGTFSFVIKDMPAGQRSLEVRAQSVPAVSRTVPWVGVGDIFIIAGQSNASGRGVIDSTSQNSVLHAGLFGNDDRWKDLRDPVDSPVRQVDKVSRDSLAHGSVWPLLATGLMDAEPVPVAFVPCAKSTTSISRWLRRPDRPYSRDTLYGSMVRRARAVGGVRAVLFWQGEADARAGVPETDYEAALSTLAADVRRDLRVPLVAAQIGDYDVRYTATGVNGIRLAQEGAWGQGTAVAGPVLYDIDLHGRVHFTQPSELQLAARRWTAAILAGVEHHDVPQGPVLQRAVYDGWETVDLTFAVPAAGLRGGSVGGLTVQTPDGDPVAYEYAAVTGAADVSVYLLAPVTEPLLVSLGSGRDGAGRAVPVEGSAWALPALPFVAAPVETIAPAAPALVAQAGPSRLGARAP
jgi:hypothetical protein